MVHKLYRFNYRHITEFHYILTADCNSQQFRFQFVPVAFRAYIDAHMLCHFLFYPFRAGFPVSPFQIIYNTFEGMIPLLYSSVPACICVFKLFASGAVKERLSEVFRQLSEWCIKICTIFICKCPYDLPVEAGMLHGSKNIAEALVVYAFILIRYYQIRVDTLYETKTVTFRTCSHRIIEREHSRFKLFYAHPVVRTCQACTEGFFFDFSVFVYNDLNQTFTVCES